MPSAIWAAKETEALDFILTEFPGLERAGDARLHAESPTRVDFWIRLCQDALDGTAELLIGCDVQDRSPEFLRDWFRQRIRAGIRQGNDGRWHAEDAAERKWIWNATDKKWVPGLGESA
jgi:hypothetical protein